MKDLPAVRRLEAQLRRDGVDVLLVNIHTEPGLTLIDRYQFEFSPTYILFDGSGMEIWRSNRQPSRDLIRSEIARQN